MAGGSGAKQNIEGLQHEGNVGVQSAFLKDVVIQDMNNHFLEECNDLLVLDVGQDQYSNFVDELLSKCMMTVTDAMPKNKRPTTTLQLPSSERNFERKFTVAVNEE